MVTIEVFEVFNDGDQRPIGKCDFAHIPSSGDIVEIVPSLQPPYSYDVVGVVHWAIHESRKETLASKDDEPTIKLLVTNRQLISELL